MSLLTQLGATLGICGARVRIDVASPSQYRGGEVTGTVTLAGGAEPQTVEKLTVDLCEYWVTGSGKNRTHHERTIERSVAAEGITTTPEQESVHAFTVRLPQAARCSRRREGWVLRAEAHIAMAVDARGAAELKVLPQPEILALQRAMRDVLGFTPTDWRGDEPVVRYTFAAPEWARGQIDGVTLALFADGSTVTGELELNMQEHGVGDMFRAMVAMDRKSEPLAIPREQLLTKRGSPDPQAAAGHLYRALAAAGIAGVRPA